MQYPTQDDLRELSQSDRLKLLEDVWATFVSEPDSLPLSDEHRQEIDRRLDAIEREPNRGAAWPDVRRRITGR
jgi:putative addiction module component (TIGR02574 family)